MVKNDFLVKKAFSYLRFSTPEQMAGDSFRRQTALAQEYAKAKGLELDENLTFQDLGVSAYRGKNADTGRLSEFLDAVKADLVPRGSYLLVESLDRISRQAARKALRILESLCDEGITVVTLADNREYTKEALDSDPLALIMSILTFLRANEESAMKSRRIKAAWVGKRQKADSKNPLTGKCPGWLTWDKEEKTWVVDKERAKVVRSVFQDSLKGLGKQAIAERLNQEKVPVFGRGKSKGRMWWPSYITKLLQSPAVIGTHVPCVLEHREGKILRVPQAPIPNYFPAIVSTEDFNKVQSMRQASKSVTRGRHAKGELKNIFGGLCVCARCGAPTTTVYKGEGKAGGKRYLVCSKAKVGAGCKYKATDYPTIEKAFLRDASSLLSLTKTPGTGDIDRELEATEASLSANQDALSGLLQALEKNPQSSTLSSRLAELEAERDEFKKKLEELQVRQETAQGPFLKKRVGELKAALQGQPMDKRLVNALLKQVFSAVVLDPSAGVMTLQWKHGGETDVVIGVPEKRRVSEKTTGSKQ